MQYLLSVFPGEYTDEHPVEGMEEAYKAVEAYNNELKDANAYVFAGGLRPANTATTITPKDGNTTLTDGPFAETKEQIGGFWVIRADDLDAAPEWGRKGAVACQGVVEVRPFQDDQED